MKKNIILIGMPGAGKSTIGVQLAKHMGLHFIDTDLIIQSEQGRQLQSILDSEGYLALRRIEEEVLLRLTAKNTLISTGGSAVYSDKGMRHLKVQGVVVYLEVGLASLLKRVNDESTRGIARPEGQTFNNVYDERTPLYKKYADIIINNDHMTDLHHLADTIQHYAQ